MKKLFNKCKDFYVNNNGAIYASVIGPFIMGTIHLVFILIQFDWILVNYCVFSYLMMLFRIWQLLIDKYQLKMNHYIVGVISVTILIAPMMASLVMTILSEDNPHYLFDWFIYVYALYGTVRMVVASRNLAKKNKQDRQYVLAFLGMIGALYTIQMMEFNLISIFGNHNDNAMYLLQLFSQGAIFVFSLYVIGLFIYKSFKSKQLASNVEK